MLLIDTGLIHSTTYTATVYFKSALHAEISKESYSFSKLLLSSTVLFFLCVTLLHLQNNLNYFMHLVLFIVLCMCYIVVDTTKEAVVMLLIVVHSVIIIKSHKVLGYE